MSSFMIILTSLPGRLIQATDLYQRLVSTLPFSTTIKPFCIFRRSDFACWGGRLPITQGSDNDTPNFMSAVLYVLHTYSWLYHRSRDCKCLMASFHMAFRSSLAARGTTSRPPRISKFCIETFLELAYRDHCAGPFDP